MPPHTPVPGLLLVPGYLDADHQAALLGSVDAEPWSAELRRRVQHHGYRYDYRRRSVAPDMYLGELPGWARELADRLHADGYAPSVLDQVIVNEYLPGQGISPHVDCVPCFGATVLSVSLGSACVLTMSDPAAGTKVPVLLEPGGLRAMSGPARYEWLHGIAPRRTDRFEGRTITRDRRVSLTFRSVVRAKSPAA